MTHLLEITLKTARWVYEKTFGYPKFDERDEMSLNEGEGFLCEKILSGNPCMIARYGATELLAITNYLSVKQHDRSYLKFIKGEISEWWWNQGVLNQMERWSGFFPPSEENVAKFSEMMLKDSKELDGVALFPPIMSNILKIKRYIPSNATYFPMASMDSFIFEKPWTKVLEGKRVLVIHPFAKLIEEQYKKRERLFENKDVLPSFTLFAIEAVQSLGGKANGHNNWFEALEWMKEKMDKIDYDVALIGCGAYGFPLAAYAKRTGHQSVHIGGSLQLLFGIKGKRWENPRYGIKYGIPEGTYSNILNNPAWVRPGQYRTMESDKVENACYW